MVCQQPDSPEAEKWKCPYPDKWILQGTNKGTPGTLGPKLAYTVLVQGTC